MKRFLKIGDILIYVLAAALIIFSFIGARWLDSKARSKIVVIEVNGKVVKTYSLVKGMKSRQIRIDAGDGKYNIIHIQYDSVKVDSANCPDQVCVHWGSISKVGQSIVCLPNKVVVKIMGSEAKEPVDDIT